MISADPETAKSYQQIIDNYQKDHAGVKINLEAVSGAYPYDKILTAHDGLRARPAG